jgi:predicted PurR-regulated permease PerM
MTSLNGIPGKADFYSERLVDFVETVLTPFNLTFNELLKLFNVSVDEVETKSVIQTLFSSGLLQKTFLSISSFLGDVLVTIIFWLFMIYGKNHFDEKVKIAFDKSGSNISDTIIKVDEQIQSYLFIKTILSLATGVIATIIMIIFDVDFPFLWGLLTFTLNYIPNVGSLIATIFPIIITLLKFGFGVHSIALSALLVANQFLIGNFIEPYFLSRKMNLSAVFVLISLIFWGWVWGIAGMFLAVPIAAIMKIVFENIEALKTFSILMGSKAGSYE